MTTYLIDLHEYLGDYNRVSANPNFVHHDLYICDNVIRCSKCNLIGSALKESCTNETINWKQGFNMKYMQGFPGTVYRMHSHGDKSKITYCLMAGHSDNECIYYYLDDEELPECFPPDIVAALRKLKSSEQVECRFVPDFRFKVTDDEKERGPGMYDGAVTIDDLIDRIPENII